MKKILFLTIMQLWRVTFAQYCIPVTGDYCCGFGITKVMFNTIDNASSNASVGYQNFTSQQTSVLVGQNYSLYVKCDVPSEHNVKAWIDWNNDSIFDDINEVVFTAYQVLNCTASVNIPSNALFDTPLRLRVSADYYLEDIPTPCDSLERGQAEDYTVIVLQNTLPPDAGFTVDNAISCTGNVQFTDNSTNLPTQWLWNFGDQTTSTLQNPAHTYASSGTYTVRLIASNSNGSDTLIKNNFISINLAGQVTPASCTPTTLANCCNYGIYSVSFNTINNSTSGGSDSYIDYSCTKNTTVSVGMNYNLQVSTGPDNPEDLRVWLDLNNDGTLDDITEKIFSSFNSKIHFGSITIPSSTVLGVRLRMRIISESVGNAVTSCTNPLFGQTEDYGVTIINPSLVPTANFTADSTSTCSGMINFTDQSTNTPTSWLWNFGDGSTSTLKNPQHTYINVGTYSVSLKVTNVNGNNTKTKNNYIIKSNTFCAKPPVANFNADSIYTCTGLVQFADQSSNSPVSWLWDFGDGITSTQQNPQHTFVNDGTYTVSLKATNQTGSNTNTKNNYITKSSFFCGGAPVTFFVADSTNTCTGIVQFTDQSANSPSSWLWDFGDGITSSIQNPQHSYIYDGIYSVSLKASNSTGNNTATKNNYITKSDTFCSVGTREYLIEDSGFRIFPNPSDGKFTVYGLNKIGQFSIYNVFGELIYHSNINQQKATFDSPFSSGIYFLKISNDNKTYSQKIFIEQHK